MVVSANSVTVVSLLRSRCTSQLFEIVEPVIDGDAPIDQAWLDAGRWQVDIAGTLYPAITSLRPLYDPRGERVRA